MTHIHLISVLPEALAPLQQGVVGRALDQAVFHVTHWNPRDYTQQPHGRVDDTPFGGGAGMVLMAQPLVDTVAAIKAKHGADLPVIYLAPHGQHFNQKKAVQAATWPGCILIAGRYEGIDERAIDLVVDELWSIGDYVLSGGELACAVVIDCIARLLPGVLGNPASLTQETFSQGLVEYPQYTRPADFRGQAVPAVLTQGNHKAIAAWRHAQSLGRTWQYRPDLLAQYSMRPADAQALSAFQAQMTVAEANTGDGNA